MGISHMNSNQIYSPYDHLLDQIGRMFQSLTKYKSNTPLQPEFSPEPAGTKIHLPAPIRDLDRTLFDTIDMRRSVRQFSPEPLSAKELSTMLWATQGVTFSDERYEFRATPSAGGLYPVKTYLVTFNVSNIEQGVASYDEKDHSLRWLRSGDFRKVLCDATIKQKMILESAAVFIWAADMNRSIWRYAQRAYRYIYLDAGHMAQNTALAATALGLGSCAIGAFYDDALDDLLMLDGTQQTAIYLTVIGHIRKNE